MGLIRFAVEFAGELSVGLMVGLIVKFTEDLRGWGPTT